MLKVPRRRGLAKPVASLLLFKISLLTPATEQSGSCHNWGRPGQGMCTSSQTLHGAQGPAKSQGSS